MVVINMALRDELMRKFGPKLIEAILRISIAEHNRHREHIGLPPITEEMFYDEINNDLSHIEDYDWMDI